MPEFVSRVPCPAPRSLYRRGRAAAALLTLTVALAGAGRAAAAGEPPTLKPAAGTRDFVFAEPTPAREVYRAIGDAFGLNVIFDPHLAKSTLSLEIPGADALTALDRVASAAGHFYKPLDARTIMVAADTPQNRRTYEDLVVRSFDLTDADPRTVVTLLRSILALQSVAVDEARHTLTLREVGEKMPIIEQLVEIADRRVGEAEVAVELLEVDRAALAAWLAGTAGEEAPAGEAAHRLAPGALAAFERSTAAAMLARPRLGLIGERPARFRLSGLPVAAGTEPETAGGAAGGATIHGLDPFRVFEIELSGRIHPESGGRAEVTLEFEISTRQLHRMSGAPGVDAARELVAGELASSVRLASGETFLVTDLGPAGLADPGRPSSAQVPGAAGGADRALVVALTPRVVRAPEPIPEGLEALWVGTEANIRFSGGRRLGPR
jgi:general secretion pathway protein D